MQQESKKVIVKIERDTINRGTQLFLIAKDEKGYFAYEVGNLTEISKVTGGAQRYSHRLNPSRKHGNQYGRYWRQKPFAAISQAFNRINEIAKTNVQYF